MRSLFSRVQIDGWRQVAPGSCDTWLLDQVSVVVPDNRLADGPPGRHIGYENRSRPARKHQIRNGRISSKFPAYQGSIDIVDLDLKLFKIETLARQEDPQQRTASLVAS